MPLPRPDDTDYQALLDGRGDGEMSAAERRPLSPQNQEEQAASRACKDHVEQDDKERRSKLSTVAGYIIITEFCERLAYYGFAGGFRDPFPNLVLWV